MADADFPSEEERAPPFMLATFKFEVERVLKGVIAHASMFGEVSIPGLLARVLNVGLVNGCKSCLSLLKLLIRLACIVGDISVCIDDELEDDFFLGAAGEERNSFSPCF